MMSKNGFGKCYNKYLENKSIDQQNNPELATVIAKIDRVKNIIITGKLSPVPLSKKERLRQKLTFNKQGYWEWR